MAKLTELKMAHEAEPDIFGRSEVHRGGNQSFEPCAPQAVQAGCVPTQAGRGGGGMQPHANPSGRGPWPAIGDYTTLNQTLPNGDAYRRLRCNISLPSAVCEKEAATACSGDGACLSFALCDWLSQCSQETEKGTALLFTGEESKHTAPKPFWTTWRKLHSEETATAENDSKAQVKEGGGGGVQWPLCCQKEFSGDWKDVLAGGNSQ